MGCDIHTFYEVLGPDGKWQWFDDRAPFRRPGQDLSKSLDFDEDTDDAAYDAHNKTPFHLSRDYDMFGALSGVRGWSKYPTVTKLALVYQRLGLSPEVQAEFSRWDGDAHNLCVVSLARALTYPYDDGEWVSGYAYLRTFPRVAQKWPSVVESYMWTEGTHVEPSFTNGVLVVDEFQAWEILEGRIALPSNVQVYVPVTVWVSPRTHLGRQWFKLLEALKPLGPPTDVRIIAWYDN